MNDNYLHGFNKGSNTTTVDTIFVNGALRSLREKNNFSIKAFVSWEGGNKGTKFYYVDDNNNLCLYNILTDKSSTIINSLQYIPTSETSHGNLFFDLPNHYIVYGCVYEKGTGAFVKNLGSAFGIREDLLTGDLYCITSVKTTTSSPYKHLVTINKLNKNTLLTEDTYSFTISVSSSTYGDVTTLITAWCMYNGRLVFSRSTSSGYSSLYKYSPSDNKVYTLLDDCFRNSSSYMKYYENGWFFTCYGNSDDNDLSYRKFRVDLDTTTETERDYIYWRIPINAVCHNNFGCNSKICIGRRALNILDMDKITVHQITLDGIEFSNKGNSVSKTTYTTYVYNNDIYAVDVDTVSKYMHIYKIM